MAKSSQESKQRFVERATKATNDEGEDEDKDKRWGGSRDECKRATLWTFPFCRHRQRRRLRLRRRRCCCGRRWHNQKAARAAKEEQAGQGRAPIGYINRSSRPVRVRIFSLFDRCPGTFYTVGESLTCVLTTHNASARISSECECECEYKCECECKHWVSAFAPCYLRHQITFMYVLIFALKASNRIENASEHIDWTQIATGYCDWHPSRFYYGCASSAIESIDTHSNCSQSVTPTEQNIDGGIWQTN